MRKKNFLKYILLVGAVLLVLTLSSWGYLGGVKSIVRWVSWPFLISADYVERFAADGMSLLLHVPFSAEESRRIRDENIGLRARVASLEYMERENRELRTALGRLDKLELQAIEARVLARSAASTGDAFTIDGGTRVGIEVGMPVLAQGDILLGRVTEVSDTSAVVKLVSSAKEKTEVYLPGSDLVSVAEGEGLGVFAIKVPASFSIQEGEGIFSSGARDFLLGFVDKIEKLDAGLFQVVKSKIPINSSDIRQVFVVRNL
ncbi:MAG: hypothetical protein A3C84_02455 [Candidatus Ryanbacteria bacterium RIFCSPHIGHO2_02_FULL_48_12]|uniref:Cell shape-determining protein MreC n=1 Tax=Candidatus Ryanbacteria bacterium RIFCSPHIGHO2_01_FULL_48_27 TaxID=1802115 RepID=A0A1G2G714_9BACT|nr:MAG: hypothetical protein A2756_02055 [Candidatus Ryanbacteria bacterium RIFCSPHIGHO2_01_FULL_48_27]OGZ50168.1 MAG: hypothetical protein A3C84_02455 [Candidatus Ryanbacteria bacterium RIFCSPHIGHO2_02_FULL_48_12]